jgi:hypothetical protein
MTHSFVLTNPHPYVQFIYKEARIEIMTHAALSTEEELRDVYLTFSFEKRREMDNAFKRLAEAFSILPVRRTAKKDGSNNIAVFADSNNAKREVIVLAGKSRSYQALYFLAAAKGIDISDNPDAANYPGILNDLQRKYLEWISLGRRARRCLLSRPWLSQWH